MSRFEQVFETHRATVDFKIVYIRDSHPSFGFRVPTNDRRGLAPEKEPKTLADRERWACADRKKMTCTIPIVMDTMDDATMKAFGAFPQRIVIVRKSGEIAYLSSGLVGFKLQDVETALEQLTAKK